MLYIDVVGIGKKTITKEPTIMSNEIRDINFYLVIAKKLIRSIASKYHIGLSEEILKNDDAVGNIVHQLMWADHTWNGNGSIEGFRKQHAIWAIKSFLTRQKRAKKHLSIHYPIDDNGHEFKDMIADTRDINPVHILCKDEEITIQKRLVDMLLESGGLTHNQKTCISMHYLEGKSLSSIAREFNVTRQAIKQSVKSGLLKLRTLCH